MFVMMNDYDLCIKPMVVVSLGSERSGDIFCNISVLGIGVVLIRAVFLAD